MSAHKHKIIKRFPFKLSEHSVFAACVVSVSWGGNVIVSVSVLLSENNWSYWMIIVDSKQFSSFLFFSFQLNVQSSKQTKNPFWWWNQRFIMLLKLRWNKMSLCFSFIILLIEHQFPVALYVLSRVYSFLIVW